MFSTDTYFQVCISLTTQFHTQFNQTAYTFLIQYSERIGFQNSFLEKEAFCLMRNASLNLRDSYQSVFT